MSSVFLDLIQENNQFYMKQTKCVENIYTNQLEQKDLVDEIMKTFRASLRDAIKLGYNHIADLLIGIGKEFVKEPYTNFVQYCHSIAYFTSKIKDTEQQKVCLEKIMNLLDDKQDKDNYTTQISVLNGFFNSCQSDSTNRLIILKKMIKICRQHSKEYLFAPYLLNIDDLLDISVYSLKEQLKLYEKFLKIIEKTIKRDDAYLLIMDYMGLLNGADDEQFEKKKDKLQKYILKIAEDDKRLFDIENALFQPCAMKLMEKNKDLSKTFSTLTTGEISNIKESWDQSEKLFMEHDISKNDYSDKVKLTKLIEIADKRSILSYKEVGELMKIDQEEVEFLVIKAIENDFVLAVLDQPNEVIYFNKVLKRNVGMTNFGDIDTGLKKLLETLSNFKIEACN